MFLLRGEMFLFAPFLTFLCSYFRQWEMKGINRQIMDYFQEQKDHMLNHIYSNNIKRTC